MKFYNTLHPYYCGIDLHARSLYVCIIDHEGNTCTHKEISANPNKLSKLLEPYLGNIVVGVECMHCWYWVADFCNDQSIDFILGHALYMKAIHGGKARMIGLIPSKLPILSEVEIFRWPMCTLKKCVPPVTCCADA